MLAQVVVTGSTTTTVTLGPSGLSGRPDGSLYPHGQRGHPWQREAAGDADTRGYTHEYNHLHHDARSRREPPTLFRAALGVSGTHSITANFVTSDTNFIGSTGSVSQVVSATATTLSIAPSIAASAVDQPVAFTITLTPALSGSSLPKGIVTLTDAFTGNPICSQTVAADGTVPSCSTSFLAPGSHTVTAAYASSDGNFTRSTSSPVTITVTAAPTSVVVSSISPSPSSVNQSISFSALVTPAFSAIGLTAPNRLRCLLNRDNFHLHALL